ncbi:MAG: hypothetical protein ACRYF0_15805, partial [Janthinobacterium lividum]
MLPEETPTPDQNTPANPADRMSVLEARLAEIRAQQGAGSTESVPAPPPSPAQPAQSETPAEAAVPPGGGATQVEPDPLRSEPGLAEELAQPTPATEAPADAEIPATPEATAAAETAQHVPTEVAAEHLSAPQARAVAHYGEAMAPTAGQDEQAPAAS